MIKLKSETMIEELRAVEKVKLQNAFFKSKKESEVVLCQLMLPNNSNFSGKIHGGFILSLMDQVVYVWRVNILVIIV